jgi:HEAT repeat protein
MAEAYCMPEFSQTVLADHAQGVPGDPIRGSHRLAPGPRGATPITGIPRPFSYYGIGGIMLRILLLTCLVATSMAAEETFDEALKKTNLSDASSLYQLAQWCAEHNAPTKARQYYGQVIKLDKDHEGARAALGYIRAGDRWVSASAQAAAGKDAPARGGKDDVGAAATPAPTAAQVQWDLNVPVDPQPDNPFINAYIERLPTLKNDSNEMESAIATVMMPDNLPMGLPRLCAALGRPDFMDIYGASNLANNLAKSGDWANARVLQGFLAKASERITDAEDLEAFAFAMGVFKDKRAVPRLIELLDHPVASVKQTAGTSIGLITALPQPVVKARAKEWWERNHDVSEKSVFMQQLRSPDPTVSVEAAKVLIDQREKEAVPVAIKLLRSDDRAIATKAFRLVVQVSGRDWAYDVALPKDQREKRVQMVEKWWKEAGPRFVWPQDAKAARAEEAAAPAAPVDPTIGWVKQLGSIEGTVAQQAEASLQGAGPAAVPALIAGLENEASIVRRQCNDLLRTITKQDMTFDARGEPAERAKAIEAWRAWARKQGMLKDGEEGGGEAK